MWVEYSSQLLLLLGNGLNFPEGNQFEMNMGEKQRHFEYVKYIF